MNKIDYIRGKSESYDWGKEERKLTIKQMTNGELIDLMEEFQKEWDDAQDTKLESEEFLNVVRNKPAYFINQVVEEEFTEDDFLNGYPNDLYNVFQVFKEVNFTFLTHLKGKMGAVTKMLQGQS